MLINDDGYELVRFGGELICAVAPEGTTLKEAQLYGMRVLNLPASAMIVRENDEREPSLVAFEYE